MLSIIMLSIIMLSIVILSIVMLSVVMLSAIMLRVMGPSLYVYTTICMVCSMFLGLPKGVIKALVCDIAVRFVGVNAS